MPRPRILYLSRWFPDPPDNGTRLRVWWQLRALAERHDVTLLAFTEPGQGAQPSDALQRLCSRIVTVPHRSFQRHSLRAYAGFLSRRPRSLVDTFSLEMCDAVRHETSRGGQDFAVVSTNDMIAYADALGEVPALADDIELGTLADRLVAASPLGRFRARLTWVKSIGHLARVLPRFAACTVASATEAELLSRTTPGYRTFSVIENAIDTQACAAVPIARHPHELVFAGSLTYEPNLDAMRWFCTEILPRVRARAPEAHLTITGTPGTEWSPAFEGVRLAGRVDDVRPVVASAAVSIAPIRRGGGTRLKILEAMALGTPVVSTSKGAEGLAVVHGEHLLIGDDAEVIAAHIARLLRDQALRRRLAEAARVLVATRYDAAVVGKRFVELVDSILARQCPPAEAQC